MAVAGSTISTGQNAAPLSSGTFTCGATSYDYQTANLTANSTLSEGSKTFQVTSTDAAANSATTSWSVTVDNTAPTATAFHTVNHTGGTAGKLEVGDQIVFTYSEALNLPSIKSGWNGTSTIITVTLNDNVASFGRHDTVTSNVNLGTIDLGAGNYTALASVFAASMVWDATAKTITITITSIATDKTLTGLSSTATYIPSSVVTDLAGNACNTSTQPTETGKRHF